MKIFRHKMLRISTIIAAMSVCIMALQSTNVSANDDDDHDDARARKGLAIAPVPLNLRGKNRELVGLGSYITNAQGSCNECHGSPAYAVGGDPFKGEPKKVNVAGYLAGGRQFGPITSRNLTPDKSGRPVGGMTFSEFLLVMRTGVDLDKAHPQFGPLLQVMPWPVYQDMTRRDLRAIYEYLSAIPCIEGDPGIPGAPSSGRCH
jgi:hypothetical protein